MSPKLGRGFRPPTSVATHLAALRMLLIATVVFGIGYTAVVAGVAQLPGLAGSANGSLLRYRGQLVGSRLIGESFTADPAFFQSRPSAESYSGASGASNRGPESIAGPTSLLSAVCRRSYAIGKANGVNGRRPYCTATGQGQVLAMVRTNGRLDRVYAVDQVCPLRPFVSSYLGVAVQCAPKGSVFAYGQLVAVAGPGRAAGNPVPPGAVSGSASGVDPDISPAYAYLQVARVARLRHLPAAEVRALVARHIHGRDLGFLGQPYVNVLRLNLALLRLTGG